MKKKINVRNLKQIMIIAFGFVLLSNFSIYAQRSNKNGDMGKMHSKIEQLEKIKLIELLNLDEQTTLKFFARRDEHRDKQHILIDKRDNLYDMLNENLKSNNEINYKSKISEVFAIEREMIVQREKFFNSLKDILTEKQIAQIIAFESNFRDEMRHQFIKQGEKRR